MSNEKVLPAWADLALEIEAEGGAIARRARTHLDWAERRRRYLRDLPGERILEETRRSRERDARVREELTERVRALNVKIARFNALVPIASLQRVPLTVERVFDVAGETFGSTRS